MFIGLDLDGTVADFRTYTFNKVKEEFNLTEQEMKEAQNSPHFFFGKIFPRIGEEPIEQFLKKHQTEEKLMENLPAFENLEDIKNFAHSQNAKFFVVTSRCLKSYPNFYEETLNWLGKNEIDVEKKNVFFNKNKGDCIKENFRDEEVICFFEDEPRYALDIHKKTSIKVHLFDRSYNREFLPPWINRINDQEKDWIENLNS